MRYTFLIVIFLAGCSIRFNSDNLGLVPDKIEIIDEMELNFTPDKVCFSLIDSTFFFLNKSKNEVEIFRKKNRINTIGGLGFDKGKFFKVSDINVTASGYLFVLDSVKKKISKFDKNGNWLLDYKLDKMLNPSLFTINNKGKFYIYDSRDQTITFFNEINQNDKQIFGKFQILDLSKLDNSATFIYTQSKNEGITLIYNEFGFIKKEFKELLYFDNFRQGYLLKDFCLINFDEKKKLITGLDKNLELFFSDGLLLFICKNKIKVAVIKYEEKISKIER